MKFKTVVILVFCTICVQYSFGKPIKKEEKEENDPKKQEEAEYLRYLGQVSITFTLGLTMSFVYIRESGGFL